MEGWLSDLTKNLHLCEICLTRFLIFAVVTLTGFVQRRFEEHAPLRAVHRRQRPLPHLQGRERRAQERGHGGPVDHSSSL